MQEEDSNAIAPRTAFWRMQEEDSNAIALIISEPRSRVFIVWALAITISIPLRGEWVENGLWCWRALCKPVSIPLRGEWVENKLSILLMTESSCLFPSPCGVSGLKTTGAGKQVTVDFVSIPLRGEWVENTPGEATKVHNEFTSPCGVSGLKTLPFFSPCWERVSGTHFS